MARIDLSTAVREISQSCEAVRLDADTDIRGRHPFFFIAGAGLSTPSICLANEITDICRKKASLDGCDLGGAPDDPIKCYAYWLEKAHPSAMDRQKFFHGLIKSAQVSHATLRLVHLLESHLVADIVVTPNFDDLIARGLTLFGQDFLICDHEAAAARIRPSRHDAIQLVHVHGTHWNYDIRNLGHETRAAAAEAGPHGMLGLMRRLLGQKSPIVIGYSGWEGDVIMAALKERCEERTWPYNLYWFCFDEAAVASLPEWLTTHENFRMIGPSPAGVSGSEPGEMLDDRTTSDSPDLGGAQSEEDRPTLTATDVIETLIRRLRLPAPEITRDPLRVYLEQLKRSIPKQGGLEADEFAFNAVVRQVEKAIACTEQNDAEDHRNDPASEFIAELRDAARRADRDSVVRLASSLHAVGRLSDLDHSLAETAASEMVQSIRDARAANAIYSQLGVLRAIYEAHHGLKGVRASFAEGLASASRSGRTDDSIRELNTLLRAYPDDEVVRDRLAVALTSAVTGSGNDIDLARGRLENLRALARDYANDTILLDRLAAGLVAAINNSEPESDWSLDLLEELRSLYKEHTDSATIPGRFAAGLNASVSRGQPRVDYLIERIDELQALNRDHPDDPTILQKLASALVKAHAGAIPNSDPEVEFVDRLRSLVRRYPSDPAIRDRFATVLLRAFGKSETPLDRLSDQMNELQVLAEDQPPDSIAFGWIIKACTEQINAMASSTDPHWKDQLDARLIVLRDALCADPSVEAAVRDYVQAALEAARQQNDVWQEAFLIEVERGMFAQ